MLYMITAQREITRSEILLHLHSAQMKIKIITTQGLQCDNIDNMQNAISIDEVEEKVKPDSALLCLHDENLIYIDCHE